MIMLQRTMFKKHKTHKKTSSPSFSFHYRICTQLTGTPPRQLTHTNVYTLEAQITQNMPTRTIKGLPFKLDVGRKHQTINGVRLTPQEVAVYEFILGCEATFSNPILMAFVARQEGGSNVPTSYTQAKDWFAKHNSRAYSRLID